MGLVLWKYFKYLHLTRVIAILNKKDLGVCNVVADKDINADTELIPVNLSKLQQIVLPH